MEILPLQPLDLLGKGTFGKVILAAETDSHVPEKRRLVAVKLLAKSRVQRIAGRVQTELRVLTEVAPTCQNLVCCQAAYQTDAFIAIVLGFCEGGDMRMMLRKRGGEQRMLQAEAAYYASQIIEGVAHLHRHNVLYRDLKPDNILLSRIGSSSIIKLTDFGLSKFLDTTSPPGCSFPVSYGRPRIPRTRTCCGTPAYQSPEMVRGKAYGLEVDWWAFGVVLYEMLVGKLPFPGETVADVHEAILRQQPILPDLLTKESRDLFQELFHPKRSKRLGFGHVSQVLERLKGNAMFADKPTEPSSCGIVKPILPHFCSSEVIPPFSPKFDAETYPQPSTVKFNIPGCTLLPNGALENFARCEPRLASSDETIETSYSSSSVCCS